MSEAEFRKRDDSWELLEDLFIEGLDLEPEARADFLDARGVSADLRRELAELWRQDEQHEPVLTSLLEMSRTIWNHSMDIDQIGEYRLSEVLGQGGMGVVYRAEQPSIDRQVAIKVLPPHLLEWESFRLNFQREQRALGSMNHPNIATVHDAGIFEGQPYLVMELLECESITAYADRHRLGIRARVDLFLDFLGGLQHAHHKPVIHCDIKPSNVLVLETEGRAVPKIIDFGIAKAGRGDREEEAAALGTPAYMSPEQASLRMDELSIASDIYSAGVLLFELLLGETPFARQLKACATLAEKRAVIQNGELPVPSELIAEDPHRFEDAARARATTPKKLAHVVKCELSWILQRALAKDPDKRYDGCAAFAQDLRRYRQQEPVSAAPDQIWYPRLKWLGNHKGLVAVLLAVPLFLTFHLVQTRAALIETRAAEAEMQGVHEFMLNIFSWASPYREGPNMKVRDLIDRAAAQVATTNFSERPEHEAELHKLLGQLYLELGKHDLARHHFSHALGTYETLLGETDKRSLEVLQKAAYTYYLQGDREKSTELFSKALALTVAQYGEDHALTAQLRGGLAMPLAALGKTEEAEANFQKALTYARGHLDHGSNRLLVTLNNYGDHLVELNLLKKAEKVFLKILAVYADLPDIHPIDLTNVKHNLAHVYHKQGNYEAAVRTGRETYEERRRLLGVHHPETLSTLNNYAASLAKFRSPVEAADLLRTSLIGISPQSADPRVLLRLYHGLGNALVQAGKPEEAEPILLDTWQQRVALFGESDRSTMKTRATLGEALQAMGRLVEAERVYLEVWTLAAADLGKDHRETRMYRRLLDDCRVARRSEAK
ncbi:serine/threonine-protein kinase [Sulfidibacter corallicola]|uniref:Serine/threonine protein kinase n=1 Tax=Sulfidibacter corallicola TaxID=2818388 RepID=A0A8A4TPH4_SULCO|nr:serine/threonine-protein kinase [Sulfidibacter corallicola]QTD51876.1 serine/threonine protein kinase [Sulfidibacter corallicola]